MSDAATVHVSSKKAGERAAAEAIQLVPAIGHVPDHVDPHCDAVATTTLDAHDARFPFTGFDTLQSGTRVEIKSAMVVYASGDRGRFYLRPQQHRSLLDRDGVYLFVVCEPTPDRGVLAMHAVSAAHVDTYLPEWFNGGDGRSDYAQLAWSNFIATEEVGSR